MYKKDTKVWIPCADNVWEAATVLEDYEDNESVLIVQTLNASEKMGIIINVKSELPPMYLPEDDLLDARVNLTSLKILHQASILNTLQKRFERRCLYNYCGVVTVFLNSFADPDIANNSNISNYKGQPINELQPHVFSVCEKVFTRLERQQRDQSLIFTGESGSGKTENAKKAILYFTTTGTTDHIIKNKILASLTVLKSFGNAKTIKNDNSSRFGNFIEIQYNNNNELIGAEMKTYLFDRSRVVTQAHDEQNFHVFYQWYAAMHRFPNLYEVIQLYKNEFYHAEQKNYLQNNNEDYLKRFDELIAALNVLGFSDKHQDDILKILTAILCIGKIEFKKHESTEIVAYAESCFIDNCNHLELLSKLLGIDRKSVNIMRKWMCYKRSFSQRDEILEPMTLNQAIRTRNTLAKFLYTKLFNWIVVQINASFRSPCNVQSFIGILDFQGFEKLNVNSFEQFCINYLDEKIQQFFIQSVFKLEQEEYFREAIGWTFIRFQDNRQSLELLEAKSGIVDIIDEETKLNMTSQHLSTAWIENLFTKCEKAKNFEKVENNSENFIIHHFIDKVQYDANEFCEKNRDTASRELLGILKDSKHELLTKLVIDEYIKLSQRGRRKSSGHRRTSQCFKAVRKTLVTELRYSLDMLKVKLSNTTPYFVRCIKSNDDKQPFALDLPRVSEQLQVFDILNTIQISKNGYFCQQSYNSFLSRYYCLCSNSSKQDDAKGCCRLIIDTCIENTEKIKFGKTKIFLHEDAIEQLESRRDVKRQNAAMIIQKATRHYLQEYRYQHLQDAVVCLQRCIRQFLAYRRERTILRNQAARKIQACTRNWLRHRNQVREQQQIQMVIAAVTDIQRFVRGFLARRECERRIRNIVIIQSCVRRFLAGTTLKKLRNQEERIRLLNTGLKNKIDLLQKKIDCLMEKHLSEKELEEMQTISDRHKCIQAKNKVLNQLLFQKIETLKKLRGEKMNSVLPKVPKIKIEKYEGNKKIDCKNNDKDLTQCMSEKDDCTLYKKIFQSYHSFNEHAKDLKKRLGLNKSEITRLKSSIKASKKDDKNFTNNKHYAGDKPDKSFAEDNNRKTTEKNIYKGMFEFDFEEKKVDLLMNRLIVELDPITIIEIVPYFPSQILFMCIRYLDSLNNRQAACYLIKSYIKTAKNVIKQRNYFDLISLWLVNTHQLLDYMKQYSKNNDEKKNGDQFQISNTDRQNEHRLQNLDLCNQWEKLNKTCQWITKIAMKQMKSRTLEFMIPALLDNEEVKELDENMLYYEEEQSLPRQKLAQLIKEFSYFYESLKRCQTDRKVVVQMFRQLFKFLSTMVLCNIITRKELCTSLKGIQIRSNLRNIERWAANKQLLSAISALNPVVQATRFLIIQPIDECSVNWIAKHYTQLNHNQIIKLMNLYISVSDSDNQIGENIIAELESKLVDREQLDDTIILDGEHSMEFPFEYSAIRFEVLEIPEEFNLSMLKKI